MEFCWCTITVRNLEESVRFYQEIVGLALENRFQAGPETEIAFLGSGETKVELICYKGKEVRHSQDISLGFRVDSLDDALAFTQSRGIPVTAGPFSPNPRTKFFFVNDPNGLKIQFVEQNIR